MFGPFHAFSTVEEPVDEGRAADQGPQRCIDRSMYSPANRPPLKQFNRAANPKIKYEGPASQNLDLAQIEN
jgi:hypothetical protein